METFEQKLETYMAILITAQNTLHMAEKTPELVRSGAIDPGVAFGAKLNVMEKIREIGRDADALAAQVTGLKADSERLGALIAERRTPGR